MRYVPLTRSSTISPIVGFLGSVGVSTTRLLAKAGLPPWITSDGETLIPSRSVGSLLEAAARELEEPNLGLTDGERTSFEALGTFGRLARRAPTLGAALRTVVRYSAIFTSSGRMSLRPRGGLVEFRWALVPGFDPRDVAWQQTQLHTLGRMVALVRLGAGPGWRPAEVHLQTDEVAGLRDAASLAATRIAFRQSATMVAVPRALLAMQLPPPPPTDVPPDVEHWQSCAPARDFAGSIRQAVETLSCGESYPCVRETADFVGMSVRTLQRRLAAARVSHDVLVAQARFASAAAMLEHTNAKILDLALDLGYSDHANFTRAFRRWAGCPPQEYRSRYGRRGPVGERSTIERGRRDNRLGT